MTVWQEALKIASLESMQPNNAEISTGRYVACKGRSRTCQLARAPKFAPQCRLTDVCMRGVYARACALVCVCVVCTGTLSLAGRELAAAGCKAVLMEKAVVGDSEDVHYTSFCVDGLTSKASSEFKITGMTGHVNGHFGTGTFEKSTNAIQWKRMGGEGTGPSVSSTAAVVGKSAMRNWAAK